MTTTSAATNAPPFTDFIHLISQSPTELTSLLKSLYDVAVTNDATRSAAVDLMRQHADHQTLMKKREASMIGRWRLFTPADPSDTTNATADAADAHVQMIGRLTMTALNGSHVSGFLYFALDQQYVLQHRSPTSSHTKLDSGNNVHVSLVATPNSKVVSDKAQSQRPLVGTLDISLSEDGRRLRGELIIPADTENNGDELEGIIQTFIGRREHVNDPPAR